MHMKWKYACSILMVLVIMFSIYACAYSHFFIMDSMGMPSHTSPTEHIDHAHVLNLATIPAIVIFSLSCLIAMFLYRSITPNTLSVFLYKLVEILPPKFRKNELRIHNPRSPPFMLEIVYY